MPLKSQGPLQMRRSQLRHLLKGSWGCLREFLSAVLCYEFMIGFPSFGERRQVDDLKKALCLELRVDLARSVFRVVCRRQSTLPCLHFKRPR